MQDETPAEYSCFKRPPERRDREMQKCNNPRETAHLAVGPKGKSNDGELMISILASYAQEESRSASENQKWRVKRNFEEGKPWRY